MNRHRFLWTLAALLAGCRPANSSMPTAYVPGSQPFIPLAPSLIPTVRVPQTAQPLPLSVPITDSAKLYVHSYRTPPDIFSWALTIDGLVDHPLTLSMDTIQSLPAIEVMRTLECIGNGVGGGLIGNVNWTGIAINELFARVGVNKASTHIRFEAADGYTTTVERAWLMQPGVLLVYAINGAPLTAEHGYPLRILIPGLYGQKMPKWITRLTFTDHDSLGYWEGPAYSWSNVAAVRTNSQLVTPGRKAAFASLIRVAGLAYAGKRRITAVEVSTKGSGKDANWQPAALIAPPTPLAWTWWVYDWTPLAPGSYTLAVRATDETGFTQFRPATGLMAGAYPDGTDAIHVTGVQLE